MPLNTRLPASLPYMLLFVWASTVFAGPPPWPDDPYVRQLVEHVLPDTSGEWDGYEFARRSSRGATYIAVGLLWRDGPHDRDAVAAILRGVLELQYKDGADSERHGVWQRQLGETEHDANWREFVGCGLILIMETFPDRLPADLVPDVRAALLRAAEGTDQRNVGAGYTNIALMSAFLLDYVGTKEAREDLQQSGREKAEEIHDLFRLHKTFYEYNSPTYYGTDLMALALWREHACSERIRQLGRSIEVDLWRDIGVFYHAEMRNMCGPFVRAYGMDMTKYCALTGLWIALAVADPVSAPWPSSGGHGQGERVYGPVFAILRPEVPGDVIEHLRSFTGPRTLKRQFRDTQVTVLIENQLMMGAATMKRRWDQHHPATIYWRPAIDQPVGWILLTGMNEGVAPTVSDRSLKIRRWSKSNEPIQLLVFAPELDETAIKPDHWDLPGIGVAVDLADGVTLARVGWINHRRYGRCLEVCYSTSENMAGDTPALSLRPER